MIAPLLAAALPAVIGAGLGYLGVRASNAASAREAQKNRQFQADMSSSSHQREVRDLQAAGLHPMLSANQGASTPSGAVAPVENVGEGAMRGVATALAVRQARAQIALTEAQAERESESAAATRYENYEKQTTGPYRISLAEAQARLAQSNAEQARDLLPLVLQKAREEIQLTVSSARAAKARAVLDEAAREGAMNLEDFERRVGEFGPWVQLFFQAVKAVKK